MILYGQSAGAGAVFSYAYSYPTDPIVTGFVASSGGASTNSPTDLNPNFQSVAGLLGCGNLTAAAELACMQKVDAEVLRDAVVENKMAFRPVVDDVTMFTNLTERLEKGLVANKVRSLAFLCDDVNTPQPLITGFTYNEMGAFGPVPSNTTTTTTIPSNGTTAPSSGGLACGAKREATARAAYNLTTYSYLYSGNFSNVTPLPQMGGMHSCEPPPLFFFFSKTKKKEIVDCRTKQPTSPWSLAHTTSSAATRPSSSGRRVLRCRVCPFFLFSLECGKCD